MPWARRKGRRSPALAGGCYGVADVAPAVVAPVDVAPVDVGVGAGDSVVGGFVCCGVTVCRGVAVRCGDGATVGVGEECGVRRGAGRFVCVGVGVGELVCGAAAAESLGVLGGLTHA